MTQISNPDLKHFNLNIENMQTALITQGRGCDLQNVCLILFVL